MPKEAESPKRWKGKWISQKMYNKRLKLIAQNKNKRLLSQANKIKDLQREAEVSNLEKTIREAEMVIKANGKKPEIETVYCEDEVDESKELQSLETVETVENVETVETLETEESHEENHVVEGRRIVDLAELGRKLWCGTCKQALSLDNVEKECRRGFGSLLLVRCHKCLIINEVPTGKMHALTPDSRALRYNINTDLALGMLHSGLAVATFNKVLAYLKIPRILYRTLKNYEEEIGEEEIAAIKARRNCVPVLEEES